MKDIQMKLRVRRAILRKVGGTSWGLENRILTTTAHALVESVINYGLTIAGSSASEEDMRSLDTRVMNPVARHITGVSPTIRREILYTLADLRSTQNRYLLKVANIIDRALRAKNARIQKTIQKYSKKTSRFIPWRQLQIIGDKNIFVSDVLGVYWTESSEAYL